MIARNEFAVEHDLIERLAVDGVIERLAHLGRAAERIFRPLAVPDIDVNAHIAEAERGRELELRVRADILDIGRKHPLDQIEAAALEIGDTHCVLDDRQIDNSIDMDVILVPVIGEFLADDPTLRHAFDEPVRPGADRTQSKLVTRRSCRLGRYDHAGAVGQLRDQRSKRRLQLQFDGERIDDLHAIDRRQLRFAERAGHGHVALERVFRRVRVKLLAVVKFDVRPQLDRHRLPVGSGLVADRPVRLVRHGDEKVQHAARKGRCEGATTHATQKIRSSFIPILAAIDVSPSQAG